MVILPELSCRSLHVVGLRGDQARLNCVMRPALRTPAPPRATPCKAQRWNISPNAISRRTLHGFSTFNMVRSQLHVGRIICPPLESHASAGSVVHGYGARPLKWRSHHPALSTKSRDITHMIAGQAPRCQSTEMIPQSLEFDHSIRSALEAVQYCT